MGIEAVIARDIQAYKAADKKLLGRYVESTPPEGASYLGWRAPRSVFSYGLIIEAAMRAKGAPGIHFVDKKQPSDRLPLGCYVHGSEFAPPPVKRHNKVFNSDTPANNMLMYMLGLPDHVVYDFTLSGGGGHHEFLARCARGKSATEQSSLLKRAFLTSYALGYYGKQAEGLSTAQVLNASVDAVYRTLRQEGAKPFGPDEILAMGRAAVTKAGV